MKNVTFYCTCLLVLFLLGCEEDASLEKQTDPTLSGLQMNSTNEQGETSTYNMNEFPGDKTRQLRNMRTNPNLVVMGNFRLPSGSRYNVSAISNEDGISGEWSFNSTNIGKYKLESICSYAEGNESVIAAIVTEVEIPGTFQLNYIVFLKVKDNGEGGNDESDQISNYFIYFPNWFLFHPTYEDFLLETNCQSFFERPEYEGFKDVQGQIQIM